MKRFVLKSLALGLMLLSSVNANAQFNLGDILGTVTVAGSGTSSSSAGDLISGLTSIFSGEKQAPADKLVGTWVYSEPAIVFESDNFLAKAGAKIAANKIEDKMQEQLSKYGITEGSLVITFAKDGTFSETLGKKSLSGTWTIEDSKLNLTYAKVKTVSITTQLEGNTLMFVTDATKLLELVKTIGSSSSNTSLKTVTSLMKSVNGMQAGLTLVKK